MERREYLINDTVFKIVEILTLKSNLLGCYLIKMEEAKMEEGNGGRSLKRRWVIAPVVELTFY